MQITLYGAANYDRSGKIRWLLKELGQTHQDHWIDIDKGERDEGAYLNINPLGRIPAITLNDRPLIESGAIVTYLADAFPEAGLAPAVDSPDRATYLQWLFYAVSIDSFASRISIIEDIPEGEVKDQKTKAFLDEVKDLTTFLGDSLGKKDYLIGKFSAADICVGYHLYFANLWPEMSAIFEANPAVSNYLKRLKARSLAQEAKVFSFEA